MTPTRSTWSANSSMNTSPLDTLISEQISPDLQQEIITHLWGPENHRRQMSLRPYFHSYAAQCRWACLSYRDRLVIRTHGDIIKIASHIREHSWDEVKDFVGQLQWTTNPPDDQAINASIDLTVRILYMIDIGQFENAFSGRMTLTWTHGRLQNYMCERFPKGSDLDDDVKLDPSFTIGNMARIAGFKIEPTSNLCNHLRLSDRSQTVEIFHHASFLRAHMEDPVFPPGLVKETLATLALLCPKSDKETRRWAKRYSGPEALDHQLLNCGRAKRRIGDYQYWHDRLVVLKEDFDDSRPSNIMQLWYDRRDASQWYPIWIAIILTSLFGLAQSIEGALQVYKAFNP